MVELLLKRYLWLVDTLKESAEGLTFEEIADKWERSSVNDTGTELSKRTLYNHCKAVATHFGIDIECRRGRGLNRYYIANPEAIDDNALVKWALDSFSVEELLLANASISDKILLEEIPSGKQWLELVLKALHDNREVAIDYENFFARASNGTVRPLCVKLFKRRWYIIALNESGELRKYALDRVKKLTLLDTTFNYPTHFHPAGHFRNLYGIDGPGEAVPQRIVIRAYDELPAYLRSLPLHPSQHEVMVGHNYSDFVLNLTPAWDFVQELLLHREQLEVLEPQSLRDQMRQVINKMSNLYQSNN